MPRDLRTYSPRLRSPPTSMSRSSSQVSMSDEIAASVRSAAPPPWVRLVNRAVICWAFRKSIRRISIALTSAGDPDRDEVA